MCYLIAKTKVSGSNPIQPIFFFGRKKPFFETFLLSIFLQSYFIFIFIFFIYFIFIFYSFCNILYISFRQVQISETKSPFAVSESLDSASESVFPRQRTTGPCILSSCMYVDLPVLPLNTKDVTHAVLL